MSVSGTITRHEAHPPLDTRGYALFELTVSARHVCQVVMMREDARRTEALWDERLVRTGFRRVGAITEVGDQRWQVALEAVG